MSPSNSTGLLFLVRHGETPLSGRFSGSGVNPGLNRRGRAQIAAAARCLARFPIQVGYVSPLRRTQLSAKIIQGRVPIPFITQPALREIRFGAWEGLTFNEVEKKWPKLAKQWAKDPLKVRVPHGESFMSLRRRVRRFLDRIQPRLSTKNILLVAHGATLSAVVLEMLHRPNHNFPHHIQPLGSVLMMKGKRLKQIC